MMKKLFTLLTLLVAIVTGAQAADFTAPATKAYGGLTFLDVSGTDKNTSVGTNDYLCYGALYVANTLKVTTWYNSSDGSPASNKDNGIVSDFSDQGFIQVTVTTQDNTNGNGALKVHGTRIRYYYVTGATSVAGLVKDNGSSKYTQLLIQEVASDGTLGEATTIDGNKTSSQYVLDGGELDPSKYYKISFSSNNTSNCVLYQIRFGKYVAPAAPSITTQPQSAAYASGQQIAALTVEATASSGTLTYQWYSCDDANKTNAAEIDGATNASYTPTAAGFYYVTVTDSNGSIDSDVAEITVSAAEAPTISVSGAPAEAVKVGTEVILTATATGTPTPTVAWYDNADTTEPVATGATFTVPTTAASTYVYYAVASNGVGTDATSDLQTIVVKEQVAKPTITPNGAYFQDSQEVTIACTDADATIQYSTDGGTTWTDYTAAFTVTATTTVQAKAVKDGCIDSEVATATFNKVTLVEQTDVTGAATWDWSSYGASSDIKLTDTTTPTKSEEFVLANIAAYGYAAPATGFGDAQTLKIQAEYVYRNQSNTKMMQGNVVKFTTTVPGIVQVWFSNTSGRDDTPANRRYLYINGNNTDVYSLNTTMIEASASVAAGDVVINAYTGEETPASTMIRINKIVFTPTVPVTITSAGAASFSSTEALDFSAVEGITAYKATAKSDSYVHLDEVAQVPAGAGVIVKGAVGTYNVPVATGDVAELEGNLLVGTAEATYTVGEDYGKVFKYAKRTSDNVVGFQKAKADWTCQVGHAYLKLSETSARDFIGIFGEEEVVTGIDAIENGTIDNDAPAYNLAGQKVGKGYKGIVIINGKKVVK